MEDCPATRYVSALKSKFSDLIKQKNNTKWLVFDETKLKKFLFVDGNEILV